MKNFQGIFKLIENDPYLEIKQILERQDILSRNSSSTLL